MPAVICLVPSLAIVAVASAGTVVVVVDGACTDAVSVIVISSVVSPVYVVGNSANDRVDVGNGGDVTNCEWTPLPISGSCSTDNGASVCVEAGWSVVMTGPVVMSGGAVSVLTVGLRSSGAGVVGSSSVRVHLMWLSRSAVCGSGEVMTVSIRSSAAAGVDGA